MPDNVTLNQGSGGAVVAADDVGGVLHQRVKVQHGADGSATDVSTASPLPVRIGDGTEQANVTPAGELNVLATAQPGVDLGDVTVNNGPGAAAVPIQDGGNSITVDGTVSVSGAVDTELPAAAALADAAANPTTPTVGAALACYNGATWDRVRGDAANGLDVDVTRVQGTVTCAIASLPNEGQQSMANSISVAIASDQGAVPVSDGGGSLTVDGAVTANIGTTGGLALDATLTGGTAKAIARGAAKGVTPAADATVTSVDGDHNAIDVFVRGGAAGGGGTEYTEDATAAADPSGGMLIARRRDALANETTADGDNTALNCTQRGELYVKHVDAVPVSDNGASLTIDSAQLPAALAGGRLDVNIGAAGATVPVSAAALPLPAGAATLAEQQTQTTALQLLDDTVHATNAALNKAAAIAGQLDDAATTAATEGNVAPVRITPERGMHVQLRTGGNEAGTAGNPLRTDPTGTTTQPISAAALPLPAGAATLAEQQTQTASLSVIDDWDESDRCRVNPIVGQAGVAAGSGVVGATTQRVVLASDVGLPAGSNVLGGVAGDVAHDAADSGNPLKIGARAVNALPTPVANNDRTNLLADLFGRLLVSHIDPAQQLWRSANYTTIQTGAIVWDPAAGKKIAITSIVIGTYGTTPGRLILFFDDDTTYTPGTDPLVLAASFAPATGAKPGMVFTPHVPIICPTVDHELRITTDAAMSVDIAVWGYEI